MPTLRQRLLGRAKAVARAVAAPLRPVAAYMRNEASPFFQMWRPALRDWNDDVRAAWYQATARSVDMLQNSGWMTGGVQRAVHSIMGEGLRLNASPDIDALGIGAEAGATLARQIEVRWDAYSRNPRECDAGGRMTVTQMTAAALRCWFATGEIVATLPVISRVGSTSRSKVRLVSPHRLMQERNDYSRRLVQGVFYDREGAPTGYWFRMLRTDGIDEYPIIAARDDVGRPQVAHIFDGNVGQGRGLSPFVPVLQKIKQYDELSNATLMAALIHAIFAATIESNAPTSDLLQAFQNPEEQGVSGNVNDYLKARLGWYQGASVDLGQHGKIAHLFMGEKLNLQRSAAPNDTYEPFAKFLLREVATCLGVTFEQFTGDFTNATYSSVRMSIADVWPIVGYRRVNIAAAFLNLIYEAWMEEEIETGRLKVPGGLDGFLQQRSAYTLATWRGPPKPQADDFKAANAQKIWHDMGVMTDEQIIADNGGDWDRVYEQLARESEKRKQLGIVKPIQLGKPGPDPNAPDPNEPEPAPPGQPAKKKEPA